MSLVDREVAPGDLVVVRNSFKLKLRLYDNIIIDDSYRVSCFSWGKFVSDDVSNDFALVVSTTDPLGYLFFHRHATSTQEQLDFRLSVSYLLLPNSIGWLSTEWISRDIIETG